MSIPPVEIALVGRNLASQVIGDVRTQLKGLGSAGREASSGISGALATVGVSSERANAGIAVARRGFLQLALEAIGVRAPVGRVAESLGLLAGGGEAVLAVSAGIAVITAGFKYLGREAAKARKEVTDLFERADRLAGPLNQAAERDRTILDLEARRDGILAQQLSLRQQIQNIENAGLVAPQRLRDQVDALNADLVRIAHDLPRLIQQRNEANARALPRKNTGELEPIEVTAPRSESSVRAEKMDNMKREATKDAGSSEGSAIAQKFETMKQQVKKANEDIENMATELKGHIERAFGDALKEGFATAFDSGSVVDGIKAFGTALLAGLGQIFISLGGSLVQFGILMTGLQDALKAIFSSGPVAIAVGVGLIALGAALTQSAQKAASNIALGHPGGGGGGGGAGVGSGGAFGAASSASDAGGDATIVIQGGILDMGDPRQADALARAVQRLKGRRVKVVYRNG